MYLILYKGNNYYNRKIIREKSDEDYVLKHDFVELASIENIAFIVNDNLKTTQIINYDHDLYGFGDYVILYNEDNTINSRWWITNSTVIRKGQVKLDLLRDVIADWYDEVMDAATFIRKGYPQSVNDPAIFNNEAMSFNQIKQKESFIKDETKCGWYVGYLSKDLKGDLGKIQIPGDDVAVSDVYDSVESYPYSSYTAGSPYISNFGALCCNFFAYVPNGVNYCVGFDANGNKFTPDVSGYSAQDWLPDGMTMKNDVNNQRGLSTQTADGNALWDDRFWNYAKENSNWETYARLVTGAHTETETTNFINSQNGKIIQIAGVVKQVVVKNTFLHRTVDATNDSQYTQALYSIAQKLGMSTTSGIKGQVGSITYTAMGYYLDYVDISPNKQPSTYQIPDGRAATLGVPYDIFAIPAGAILGFGTPYQNTYSNTRFAQKVVASMTNQLVSSGADGAVLLYDIQYVPYCPLADEFIYEERIDTYSLRAGIDYDYLYPDPQDKTNWTIIIYASSPSFTKRINTSKIYTPTTVKDFKVANECDMYRLCSPNYNGQFEFSATKNGGVSGWNITFTYKPYTPYIKVAPIFGNLYGQNFGDARGLVCGGDFSISQTNDAWKSFELNNKNYQVMFDRQIQNLEVNNSVQREQQNWNRAFGVVSGTASGAMAGGMMGGGYGAIAGAVIGGAASAAGGIVDYRLGETLRQESVNYAQDRFGYELRNIKALPYSLTKVGSQNADYKIWPFVEYYTCTETEKNALRDKLEFDGYTIERINNISYFLKPSGISYIQGQIVRISGVANSSGVANAINSELQTGVYFVR